MEMTIRTNLGDHMKLLRAVMAYTLLLSASAYAADAPAPAGVRVIDAEAAKQCRFFDTVFGHGRGSGVVNITLEAKQDAMLNAQTAGANAIVVKAITLGTSVIVLADAYHC